MADLRIHLECIVRNNVGRLDADLAQLEAKDRINALIKLLEYVLPKQRETTAHVDGELTQTIETSLSNIEDLFKVDKDKSKDKR